VKLQLLKAEVTQVLVCLVKLIVHRSLHVLQRDDLRHIYAILL
jgi:hypothetical protein